jgi:hypothetical protein
MKSYLSLFEWLNNQYKSYCKEDKNDRRETMRFGYGIYFQSRIQGNTVKNWARKKYESISKPKEKF